MGYIRMGVPRKLVLKLAAASEAHTFIETGTFDGRTTEWAARHFTQVHTIEICPEISAAAQRRLGHPENVRFLVGDSGVELPNIVESLTGPAVFWLDGHFCGHGTGNGMLECPIMAELAAIKGRQDSIILIDDARCFLGPPPPPHKASDWVNIDAIFKYIAVHYPHHVTTIHDDVVIAVPRSLKHVIDEDWVQHYHERYLAKTRSRRSVFARFLSQQ